MKRLLLLAWLVLTSLVCAIPGQAANPPLELWMACGDGNDLFNVLKGTENVKVHRRDTAAQIIAQAPEGSAVMILAEGYPKSRTPIDEKLFAKAAAKRQRLFVEYPSSLPGIKLAGPVTSSVDRIVVCSGLFGDKLKQLRILSVNGLHYLAVDVEKPHLVAARVAGFDQAVYGLPGKRSAILFELSKGNVMVSTTALSRFVKGRYAPQDSWAHVWRGVLQWLNPKADIPELTWQPTVQPTYGRDEKLPDDFERIALRRGVEWFDRSKMIIHPSFHELVAGKERVPRIPADAPMGDGTLGSMEAVVSVIREDGSQAISSAQRGDCICESAMALAFGGKVLEEKKYAGIATNLLNYYLLESPARKNERGDPNHGAYGLIAWGITTPAWYVANYGDDNARQMLGAWAVAALNGEDGWDEAMMKCLLANLRTTGRLGFRSGRIDVGQLAGGWQRYFHRKIDNPHPHYEAYLWACFLWAYQQTGDELFLNRAETAIKLTMDRYTDGWRWTNGLAQEKARMILPLAWLVRVKDTPENRAMLKKAVDGLIAIQDESGAIREELGLPGRGQFPPPGTNAAYGTNEASLIAKNGDPVSDLLYTTNFAFLGLHEAAAATGDPQIIAAENKLAEFLCRIQVKSDTQPAVDGGWFRAFDFGRWEHWGCNADLGWGAWAIESGWTQGWIVSVLAMRQMETSLWDLTSKSQIERHYDRLRKVMIPDDVIEADARGVSSGKKVDHAAVGKTVSLQKRASAYYPGSGGKSLTDGKTSSSDHASGLWLGFHGTSLTATIDMGESKTINRVEARFLQLIPSGIHIPRSVTVEVSEDGSEYRTLKTIKSAAKERGDGRLIEKVAADGLDSRGRYLRIHAENVGTIPAGYPAAGAKAWLFVDEVLVNPKEKE